MPHANSRFSSPRAISPRASEGTLPCSAVRCAASSWRCCSTRLRMRNRMSVRLLSDVARQAGKAALAACDRGVQLRLGGEVDVAGDGAGGRIVDRALAAGGAGDELPADPVADPPGGRRGARFGFGDGRHRRFLTFRWRRATILPSVARSRRGPALRTSGASPGRASSGRPRRRPRLRRPARSAVTVTTTRHDQRSDADGHGQPAGDGQRAGGHRIAPGRARGGAHERPAGDGDEEQSAVPPGEAADEHDEGQHDRDDQRPDAFVGLRGVRRQGRRQRSPRARSQERRRPRAIERQALAASHPG